MQSLSTIIYPGFWLSLWQYGVLLVVWFQLIKPGVVFLHPWDINAAALGYFAISLIIGALFGMITLVDTALYVSTLPMGWIKRIVAIAISGIVGTSVFALVYFCGFGYGSDSTNAPLLRWIWVSIYMALVGFFIFAHIYAIWRFRTHH